MLQDHPAFTAIQKRIAATLLAKTTEIKARQPRAVHPGDAFYLDACWLLGQLEGTQKEVREAHTELQRLRHFERELQDGARCDDGGLVGLFCQNVLGSEPPEAEAAEAAIDEAKIRHMVNRFLGWRLPADFCPDAGISFKRVFNEHTPYQAEHQPSGTNLFNASQAEAMVRHMIAGTADDRSCLDVHIESVLHLRERAPHERHWCTKCARFETRPPAESSRNAGTEDQ